MINKKIYKNLNLIVCVGENNIIGDKNPTGNGLLWHIKEELLYFKSLTVNNILIFGKNTAKYVPINLMKKDREVFVLDDGINVENLLTDLSSKNKPIFICGGYSVYKYFLDNYIIENIYLSKIKNHVKVEKAEHPLYLPNIEDYGYEEISSKEFENFTAFIYKYSKF